MLERFLYGSSEVWRDFDHAVPEYLSAGREASPNLKRSQNCKRLPLFGAGFTTTRGLTDE
jgi:hypothetical protein